MPTARSVIRAVVVYTPTAEPTAPCGACRQVINEFGPDAEIVSRLRRTRQRSMLRSASSFPHAFGPAQPGRGLDQIGLSNSPADFAFAHPGPNALHSRANRSLGFARDETPR